MTTPDGSDQMKATAGNCATQVCSTHGHETVNCTTFNVADDSRLPPVTGPTMAPKVTAKPEIAARESEE